MRKKRHPVIFFILIYFLYQKNAPLYQKLSCIPLYRIFLDSVCSMMYFISFELKLLLVALIRQHRHWNLSLIFYPNHNTEFMILYWTFLVSQKPRACAALHYGDCCSALNSPNKTSTESNFFPFHGMPVLSQLNYRYISHLLIQWNVYIFLTIQ